MYSIFYIPGCLSCTFDWHDHAIKLAHHAQPVIGVPVHGAPQRESSAPRVSRESVTQLKDMFPSFDDTVLESVLTSARGNVEEAINTLLSMS